MSSWLISRPRYLNSPLPRSMNLFFLERKGQNAFRIYFSTVTRRHIGAARNPDRSPAAINNCAS